MALSLTSIKAVDSVVETISREIWKLPASFPKAGLHALITEVGLNIPLGMGRLLRCRGLLMDANPK